VIQPPGKPHLQFEINPNLNLKDKRNKHKHEGRSICLTQASKLVLNLAIL
jgi:hypothetical protein